MQLELKTFMSGTCWRVQRPCRKISKFCPFRGALQWWCTRKYFLKHTQMTNNKNNTAQLYLVSTYVVCERLSVMHRLPEFFDQIAQFTPVLEFGSEHPPPPENWNLGRSWQFGVWHFRTPLPPNFKTLIFFLESKSDLFQNTPPPPPQISKL